MVVYRNAHTTDFAHKIVRAVRAIPAGSEAWVIGRQLLKAGTSIGANVWEADAALTEREFVSCCNIARREASETRFWLRLCSDEHVLDETVVEPLLVEVEELEKILTTIVRKTRGKAASPQS